MLRVDKEVDKFMLKHEFKHEFCTHWMPLLQRIFQNANIIIIMDEFEGTECVSACLFMKVFSEDWLVEKILSYYEEMGKRCSPRFARIVCIRINPGEAAV